MGVWRNGAFEVIQGQKGLQVEYDKVKEILYVLGTDRRVHIYDPKTQQWSTPYLPNFPSFIWNFAVDPHNRNSMLISLFLL